MGATLKIGTMVLIVDDMLNDECIGKHGPIFSVHRTEPVYYVKLEEYAVPFRSDEVRPLTPEEQVTLLIGGEI